MSGLTDREHRVVEAAAAAIRPHERAGSRGRAHQGQEPTPDEIIEEALGPDRDLRTWARLARAAVRRARGGAREPPKPKRIAARGGVPEYGTVPGQDRVTPL